MTPTSNADDALHVLHGQTLPPRPVFLKKRSPFNGDKWSGPFLLEEGAGAASANQSVPPPSGVQSGAGFPLQPLVKGLEGERSEDALKRGGGGGGGSLRAPAAESAGRRWEAALGAAGSRCGRVGATQAEMQRGQLPPAVEVSLLDACLAQLLYPAPGHGGGGRAWGRCFLQRRD